MTGPPPAGLARRAIAALLDALIGALALGLAAGWLLIALSALRGLRRDLLEAAVLALAALALALALHLVYHVVFLGGCGQTPGCMAMGIAVVGRDGRAAGYGRAALRSVGGALSALTLGLLALPLLLARERRGLADRLAGTRVIRVG